MRKLLALPLLAGLIAGCGDIIRVELVPPGVAALETQAAYCTTRDTILDLRFTRTSGLITKVEVILADDQPGATEPPAGATPETEVKIGLNQVGYVLLDSNGTPGIQSLGGSASAQGITVTPVGNKRLWLRAFNGNSPSPWVKAKDPVQPSGNNDCDPLFPYGQPSGL